MNLLYLALTTTLLAVAGVIPASSNSDVISGRWTTLEKECSQPTDGIVIVTYKSIEATEYACDLLGGDASDPHHWVMRGKCAEAGEYEDGSQPPLTQIEIVERSGVLTISVGNGEPWRLAIKCTD